MHSTILSWFFIFILIICTIILQIIWKKHYKRISVYGRVMTYGSPPIDNELLVKFVDFFKLNLINGRSSADSWCYKSWHNHIRRLHKMLCFRNNGLPMLVILAKISQKWLSSLIVFYDLQRRICILNTKTEIPILVWKIIALFFELFNKVWKNWIIQYFM
jgi:hypothetical protein